MPKMDNPHAKRLYDSLITNVNIQAAEDFAEALPLSKSADYIRKFTWAEDVCKFLENHFDELTIQKIRLNCNCDSGSSKAASMRAILHKSKDLLEFTEKFNTSEDYASIEVCDGGLLFIYPVCYCSCAKRVDKPISKTWCYCTLGYAKALFEKVFEREVGVELIESIKSGGNRCIIKIII